MTRNSIFAAMAALALATPHASAQTTITVDATQPGVAVSPRLYGIFFEEINHAGDGGLYAELVQNRSFEDDDAEAVAWKAVGGAKAELTTRDMLNSAQTRALRLSVGAAGGGVTNGGYWGMAFRQQTAYAFSTFIRSDAAYKGTLNVGLTAPDGTPLGHSAVPLRLKAGQWQKIDNVQVTATGSCPEGALTLTFSAPGTFALDVVSLFPPTYKGRKNGCRIDLAEMLEALHPKFMRFPGGCYVEGQTSPKNNLQNRFVWRNTIGPIEQRPGHLSVNWGYNITDGFGYHEMLQLAEDLGAEPLFVVNVGLGHGWLQPHDQLDDYIQEALDAIEYANGDAKTTRWGAERARNGHPEPFGLRLLEVGNENANFHFDTNQDQSERYFDRYIQFYRAIKARYPDIEVIGNVEAWGTDEPSWRSEHPVDILDEHYYRSPSWFEHNYRKYDSYDRRGPKIYIGEYAVTQGFGVNGHLTAALGEAIYMLGLERNSDIVCMGSYAPIFVNEHNPAWRPDMIRFNAAESFGTPSYWVQKLMADNIGNRTVPVAVSGGIVKPTIGHHIGLSTWGTKAEFRNIAVRGLDPLPAPPTPAKGKKASKAAGDAAPAYAAIPLDKWQGLTGEGGSRAEWEVLPYTAPTPIDPAVANDDMLRQPTSPLIRQNNLRAEGSVLLNTADLGDRYAVTLQARRLEGNEGFIIAFGAKDEENLIWWNLGGWGNTQHAVEHMADGAKNTLAATPGKLEDGRWYDVEIQVEGTTARCLLDGELKHEVALPERQAIYADATIDDASHTLILKVVNPTSEPMPAKIAFNGLRLRNGRGVAQLIQLASERGSDENDMRRQLNVAPVTRHMDNPAADHIDLTVQPLSLNIFRLPLAE
ncbi:MAG: arabinosidase [Bacteroidaceae bacterium]|nr:arabinosidase [Bacteroidaceae bacterium]